MKKINPLVLVTARYGSLAGLLGGILMIVLYYIGRHPFLFPVYYDFRVILFSVFIFFALKEYRDYYREGILYLWEGFIGSFIVISAFTAVAVTVILIFGAANDAFLSTYISLSIDQLKSIPPDIIKQIGKDVYERNLAMLPGTTLGNMASLYALQSFIIGLFISIILSVILRRQPKN